MATQISNDVTLESVNEAIIAEGNDIFSHRVPQQYQQFTYERPVTGKTVRLPFLDGVPQIREWFGEREVETLRAWSVQDQIRSWESTFKVAIDDIEQDPEGLVASATLNFRSLLSTGYDKIVFDELYVNDTGPVGFDNVALFSSSHPRADGLAAQSNITTDELDYGSYRTARRLMRGFTNYRGEPLGMQPNLLVVGPELEEAAQVITGSDKPWVVGDDGDGIGKGYSDGSTVGGVVKLRNYIGGDSAVMVSERISGRRWMVVDTTKGAARPMFLGVFRSARVDIKASPEDDNVFFRDEAIYGYSAKVTPMAMCWQTAYGRPAT